MKLGEDVLLEIVEIVRDGIANGTDVSEALRAMEVLDDEPAGKVVLSPAYKALKGRVV